MLREFRPCITSILSCMHLLQHCSGDKKRKELCIIHCHLERHTSKLGVPVDWPEHGALGAAVLQEEPYSYRYEMLHPAGILLSIHTGWTPFNGSMAYLCIFTYISYICFCLTVWVTFWVCNCWSIFRKRSIWDCWILGSNDILPVCGLNPLKKMVIWNHRR